MPVHSISRPLCLVCLLPILASCSRAPEQEITRLQGVAMGTTYGVQVVGLPQTVAPQGLQRRIEEILMRVSDLMSTYRNQSEISRFNSSTSTDWFPVSAELADLVREALRVSEMSEGAFDVTVGPLVNLWGFGPGDATPSVPTIAQIEETRERVGFRKLSVRREPPALRKSVAVLYVDLSAIAKGYGVDRVAELLETLGVGNYLVEIGGEVRGLGHNGRGSPWRIAVERPDPRRRDVQLAVELRDGAMATSGDYRNFFEENGRLYSHTIDPKTGSPVTHALSSVTVLASDTASADALATAFLVLGPESGYLLAESLDAAALFIVRTGAGFSEIRTPAFERYLQRDPDGGMH